MMCIYPMILNANPTLLVRVFTTAIPFAVELKKLIDLSSIVQGVTLKIIKLSLIVFPNSSIFQQLLKLEEWNLVLNLSLTVSISKKTNKTDWRKIIRSFLNARELANFVFVKIQRKMYWYHHVGVRVHVHKFISVAFKLGFRTKLQENRQILLTSSTMTILIAKYVNRISQQPSKLVRKDIQSCRKNQN